MALRCSTERHRQEWSLRHNSIQHGWCSVGRSQLVESLVWLVPLAKIDRLTAVSLDSVDRGA